MQLPEAARSPVNAAMGKQHGKNNVFPHFMTRKVQKVAVGEEVFFFIWASRRGLVVDASKRRKHTFMDLRCETLSPPAAPSGFPLQCFLASVSVGAYAIRPYEQHRMYGRIAYAPPHCQKTFPLQSLSHARSRHLPVSRRTIRSLRPHLFPRRELRVRTFSQINGNIARIRLQTCNR